MTCFQCHPCSEKSCICRCHYYDLFPYNSVTTIMLENSWCRCGHNKQFHLVTFTSSDASSQEPTEVGCVKCNCKRFEMTETTSSRNPTFSKLMREFEEIHSKKSADYAEDKNVYSNFEFAAFYAGVTLAQAYLVIMGIKVARERQLLYGKTPLNEPLLDTFKDHSIYSAIMTANYIDNPDGFNRVPKLTFDEDE